MICQDILKEQCPRGLLAKNEHFGAIVSEIVAQLCLKNSIQTLLNFFGLTPQKIRRVGMEFSEYNQKLIMSFWYNRLTCQRQFAPKCSFLASRPLRHCSFRIS